MIEYSKLIKYSRVFVSFTGMTIPEFLLLLDKFRSAYNEQELFVKDKKRARSFGGGDVPTLIEDEQKLLFILVYYKLYPIQQRVSVWDESIKRKCVDI